jgi:hypothetical protein
MTTRQSRTHGACGTNKLARPLKGTLSQRFVFRISPCTAASYRGGLVPPRAGPSPAGYSQITDATGIGPIASEPRIERELSDILSLSYGADPKKNHWTPISGVS